MLSILICSVNASLLKQVSANIAATVAVTYELLVADNKITSEGICKVYNRLAAQAQYPYLCFIHEDVLLHSIGWGKTLIDLLADKSIGLVGISGTVYKSKYAGSWSCCQPSLYRTNSIQHFKNSATPIATNTSYENSVYEEVAVIDGVFMAIRKDMFQQFWFDENLLSEFHCYDIDYSMQVKQRYKVVVSYAILLEHFSEGKLSNDWLSSSLLVHKKWQKKMPVATEVIGDDTKNYNDYLAVKNVLAVALKSKGNKTLVMSHFVLLLGKYRRYNKYEFSKSVFKYFT